MSKRAVQNYMYQQQYKPKPQPLPEPCITPTLAVPKYKSNDKDYLGWDKYKV